MEKRAFRYLPPAPGAENWGLVVTGAGFFKTPAKSPYPPERHPDDHMYQWEYGRVLPVFQILCIHEGHGELESHIQPPQKLMADSAFLIKPGEWHRFRPDPVTGWTESWIEFQGGIPHALSDSGQLGDGLIARNGAKSADLPEAIHAVYQRVCHVLPGIDPKLTALGLEVLVAWQRLGKPKEQNADLKETLASAIRILEKDYKHPVNLESLAKRVGMSYSVFRRTFQKHTGYAPWKYVQYLRLANARHQLATSDISLAKLADELGFSSAFHLSMAFKKEFKVSPKQWKNLRNKTSSHFSPVRISLISGKAP